MKIKSFFTAALILFVVVSIGFLVYQETRKAGNTATEQVETVAEQAETVPEQAETVPEADSPKDASSQIADTESREASPVAENTSKVIAYYFYAEPRCTSCRKIEAYTKEAIQDGFRKELGDGSLEWKLVDIKAPENEHFIREYELYSKSVVLVGMKDGVQADWKNLTAIWDLLGDEPAFINYIQEETRAFLEGRY
ncbi:nitrophenyl compound nitroreductase subunit ArsF family protein [bacterium]